MTWTLAQDWAGSTDMWVALGVLGIILATFAALSVLTKR